MNTVKAWALVWSEDEKIIVYKNGMCVFSNKQDAIDEISNWHGAAVKVKRVEINVL